MSDEEFMYGDLLATVRVQDLPASREVVAVERQRNGTWRVCGSAIANADGIAELGIEGSKTSRVYAFAIDHWGEPFTPNKTVAYGDIIRPSVFLGWLYRVTAPGVLPGEEPVWWNSTPGMPRPVGSAMAQAEMYFQPIAHGPVDIEWGEEPPAPDLPTVIGEFFQGGYYIGNITIPDGPDAGEYAVIMAGAEGQATTQWKTANTNTLGTGSTVDGMANTLAMEAAGLAAHPAAAHCLGYRGDGHDDWYLPAKDELNIAWVNRAALAGLAMEVQSYWSSTQISTRYAWNQLFPNGSQRDNDKNGSFRVRPVRRLKI